MENVELQHHGTKGMKWGVRRYQNKDGSLTPDGKKRYGIGQYIKNHKTKKKRKQALEKAREVRKTKQEEAKELEEKRSKLLKSTDAAELYKNRDLLTTAEINERLMRLDTERRLSQVAESTKTSGMDRVNKALAIGKKINEVYEFTNTPVMKAFKKQLGLNVDPVSKAFDINDVYKKMNTMSSEEVKKAAERVGNMDKIKSAWEKANKGPDDGTSSNTNNSSNKPDKNDQTEKSKSTDKNDKTEKSESFSGTVEGEGTSRSKMKNDTGYTKKEKSSDYYNPIDSQFVNDTPVSEVRNSEVTQIGQNYIAGLLEDKSK